MEKYSFDTIVVGGGLAGLTCARILRQAGRRVFVAEAGDDTGGRIRTDDSGGFLMDWGFQVLQTAYPEARRALDFKALNLKTFDPGVIVHKHKRFHILADPLRKPRYILKSTFSSIASPMDYYRLLKLFFQITRRSLESIFEAPEQPTRDYLEGFGFSDNMIQNFFRPFFGGVCLDPAIGASSRVFEYVFKMFAEGDAAIPENGMAEIPRQIAADLPKECIGTRMRVSALRPNGVIFDDGRELAAETIVLAAAANEVQRLLGREERVSYFSEYCLYFAAEHPPFPNSLLILNGDGRGPINNLAVLSQVSGKYAPAGQTLMAAVVIGDDKGDADHLKQSVKTQLREWFGPAAEGWGHLKTYHIKRALPDQRPPAANPFQLNPRMGPNIYVCGEYGSLPGIQWALYSGRKAAESLLVK